MIPPDGYPPEFKPGEPIALADLRSISDAALGVTRMDGLGGSSLDSPGSYLLFPDHRLGFWARLTACVYPYYSFKEIFWSGTVWADRVPGLAGTLNARNENDADPQLPVGATTGRVVWMRLADAPVEVGSPWIFNGSSPTSTPGLVRRILTSVCPVKNESGVVIDLINQYETIYFPGAVSLGTYCVTSPADCCPTPCHTCPVTTIYRDWTLTLTAVGNADCTLCDAANQTYTFSYDDTCGVCALVQTGDAFRVCTDGPLLRWVLAYVTIIDVPDEPDWYVLLMPDNGTDCPVLDEPIDDYVEVFVLPVDADFLPLESNLFDYAEPVGTALCTYPSTLTLAPVTSSPIIDRCPDPLPGPGSGSGPWPTPTPVGGCQGCDTLPARLKICWAQPNFVPGAGTGIAYATYDPDYSATTGNKAWSLAFDAGMYQVIGYLTCEPLDECMYNGVDGPLKDADNYHKFGFFGSYHRPGGGASYAYCAAIASQGTTIAECEPFHVRVLLGTGNITQNVASSPFSQLIALDFTEDDGLPCGGGGGSSGPGPGPGDGSSCAEAILIGGTADFSFDGPGPFWFKFTADRLAPYDFTFTNTGTGNGFSVHLDGGTCDDLVEIDYSVTGIGSGSSGTAHGFIGPGQTVYLSVIVDGGSPPYAFNFNVTFSDDIKVTFSGDMSALGEVTLTHSTDGMGHDIWGASTSGCGTTSVVLTDNDDGTFTIHNGIGSDAVFSQVGTPGPLAPFTLSITGITSTGPCAGSSSVDVHS